MVNGRCIEDLEKSIDSPISLFNLAIQRDLLRPSVIVEYDRSAYVYDWGNTRITFDRNVRSSTDFIGFVHGNTCNYHTVIYDSKQTVELRLLSGQHTIYLNVIDSEAEKDRYMNKSKETQKMHQTKSTAIHFPDLTVFGLIDMFQSDIASAYNRRFITAVIITT